MKKTILFLAAIFIATQLFSQPEVIDGYVFVPEGETVSKVEENKQLSKTIFDRMNVHRNNINLKSFIWSENWYESAKIWSKFLSDNNVWYHNKTEKYQNTYGRKEMLVCVSLPIDAPLDFTMIGDSAVGQWYRSPAHVGCLELPLRTKNKKRGPLRHNNSIIPDQLYSKYAAVSAHVVYYQTYKRIRIVWEGGPFDKLYDFHDGSMLDSK